MKKFIKFLLGLTAIAAAVGGILYFLKNVLMKDYLDDYDDDDFDNDLYEEDDDDDRDYVTLTPDSVNLETDIIGKYVEQMLKFNPKQTQEPALNKNMLLENGFI